MIKEERHNFIIDLLANKKVVRVSDIINKLDVTDMTVRRDLKELETQGVLERVHGGAKLIDKSLDSELSHQEKIDINLSEKKEIAQKIAAQINNGETIFLGAGTTIELTHDYLNLDYAKIITNSIHVFNKFKNDKRLDLILVGGAYRDISGSFVGTIANDFLKSIYVEKAFIGVNAINEQSVYNSNETEGVTQRLILNNSKTKYIVADDSKFDKKDFYQFYDLTHADYLIINEAFNNELTNKYEQFVTII